jgi:transposase
MGDPRRSFSREFKVEAVRLVTEGKRRLSEVARELGIRATLLGHWWQEITDDSEAFPGKGRLKPEDAELTLHRLGLFKQLGESCKTTNCIENIMRQVGIYTDRIGYWKNSDQRQRWVGTALLEIEPKLRKVKGYRHLKELREAMKNLNQKNKATNAA